ncbi:hypothetical protein BGX23_011325 [Mortierella sp. AD031]|nr:hypothetical protein BGX23_011325 [Mortierella sp. AD031]
MVQSLWPHTWRSFVFKRRDYQSLLANPAFERRFLDRASTIREVILEGGEFSQALSLFLLKHPSLFKNRLTRLLFREWYPRKITLYMWWETHRVMEEFMDWSKDIIKSIEFQFHSRSTTSGPGIIYRVPVTQIAEMSALTSIILKDPSIKIRLDSLFLCLVNCPEQLEVLKIEHPVYLLGAGSDHIGAGDVVEHLRSTSVPRDTRTTCHCKARLEEIWPRLQSLKIKYLGIPLGLLASSLNRELPPDLRHLELDGIRRYMATNYQNMFPIYKLLLEDVYLALESLTISEDSDLVDDVPRLVALVLERHTSTLKTVRWLGSAGKVGERLDLEWFLKACPNLERVEITGDHRYCSSGQGAVGTTVLTDSALLCQPTHVPQDSLPKKSSQSSTPASSPSSPPMPLVPKLARSPSWLGPRTPSLSTTSWVCGSSLTYLDISFRPSPNNINEHRYRIQVGHFYKKLGQMTALVELHIGCECRCRGTQLRTCQHTDCKDQDGNGSLDTAATATTGLSIDSSVVEEDTEETATTIFDMSLATGLGHLAGLSKLQVLNISRIHGHKIGEPELEWMKSHWTELRVLQGVKKQHIVDWTKTNWSGLDVIWCNCELTLARKEWKWRY